MTMKNRMKNLMINIRDKLVAKKKPKPIKPAFGAAKAPLTETKSRPSDQEMEEQYQHLRRVCSRFSGKPSLLLPVEAKPLRFEPDIDLKMAIHPRKEMRPAMDIEYAISLESASDADPAYRAALDAFIGMTGGEEERRKVKPLTEPEKVEYKNIIKKIFSAPDVS